jgi:hypothetical protein
MRNLCSRPALLIHRHARVPIIVPAVLDPPNPSVALFDSTIGPSMSSIRFEMQTRASVIDANRDRVGIKSDHRF